MEWTGVIEFLRGFDVHTIISCGVIVYIAKTSIEKKIGILDGEISIKIDKLSDRFDKLSDRVDNIDKRLCRIEGALSAKECCMLTHDKHEKSAV